MPRLFRLCYKPVQLQARRVRQHRKLGLQGAGQLLLQQRKRQRGEEEEEEGQGQEVGSVECNMVDTEGGQTQQAARKRACLCARATAIGTQQGRNGVRDMKQGAAQKQTVQGGVARQPAGSSRSKVCGSCIVLLCCSTCR